LWVLLLLFYGLIIHLQIASENLSGRQIKPLIILE